MTFGHLGESMLVTDRQEGRRMIFMPCGYECDSKVQLDVGGKKGVVRGGF